MFLLVLLYTQYAKKIKIVLKMTKRQKIFLEKEDNNHLLKSTKLHILQKKINKTTVHNYTYFFKIITSKL